MVRTPKLISSKSIYKNKYLEIKVDTLELDIHQWEQAYFVKPNKNGVGIIPLDKTGIYLVYQYRHATQAFLWQIPMGMVDPGSNELETAKNELREETGLIANEFKKLGSIFAEPGMSNQEEFIYLATSITKGEQDLGETEIEMKVKHFTFAEIDSMVKSGEIKCGFTLSALELLATSHLSS